MTTAFDDADLLPAEVEPLTDAQLVYITDRLATRDVTLAFHLLGSGTQTDLLARDLGCDLATYRRLCLFGLPRDADDIPVIAERLHLNSDRLASLSHRRLVPFIGRRIVGR